MRVVLIGQHRFQGGRDGNTHPPQACDQSLAAAEALDQCVGHRRQQVALCDATAGRVLAARHHVGFRVEWSQAQAGEDVVGGLRHRQGALQPGLAFWGEPLGGALPGGGGHALHGHVSDAHRVGVVELPRRERTAGVEEGPAFETGHAAHSEDAGGLAHLGGRGDGVVVDGPDYPQPRAPSAQRRPGRGVGAEGIAGVDVVVGLHHPLWEGLPGRDGAQRGETFSRGDPRVVCLVHVVP